MIALRQGTGSARQSASSNQHTAPCIENTGLYRTLCPVSEVQNAAFSSCSTNTVDWMVRRFVPQLCRKHVRQDERDHPGYDVETQKYF